MKFDLTDKQLNEIIGILTKYSEVESALIFGSRAEGTNEEAADVDIALKGANLNSFIISDIKNNFVESYLPFFFDVVDYTHLKNQKLKSHIDYYGVKLYERENVAT